MGKIYMGQTALKFQLTTDIDISGATCTVKYQKPDGTVSGWGAIIEDASRGVIYYDIQDTDDLDQAGDWVLWAHVVFPDLSWAPGEPSTIQVHEEGK